MTFRHLVILLFALLVSVSASAQTTVNVYEEKESLADTVSHASIQKHAGYLDADFLKNVDAVYAPGIEPLMEKRIAVYQLYPEYGYRLQVYSGSNRNEAYRLQIKFALAYPDLGCYLTYQVPNYRLRVGDFINRTDAERVKKIIEHDFDIAFIVTDKLNPEKIYIEGETELH